MRKIPEIKNTVFLSSTIAISKNVEDSFRFIVEKLPDHYKEISDGHDYFRPVSGNSLSTGEKIECAEKAGNQSIVHEYIVDEIVPNTRIQYSSKPSLVKIKLPWSTIESQSNTYVFYDFDTDKQCNTLIRLTIGIQFKNLFEKLFSQLFMGIAPWKKHCNEEMTGLKQVLERSDAG